MRPDYQTEQLKRDISIVSRVTNHFEALHQGVTRWIGDEISARRNETQQLEIQAKEDSAKNAFADLQFRLNAADDQVTRIQRRMTQKLEKLITDNVGLDNPLETYYDLSDELLNQQGVMRELLVIRKIVDDSIADLPP